MMMYKATQDFLWFKTKEIIEKPDENWIKLGLVEEHVEPISKQEAEAVKEVPKKKVAKKKRTW